MTKKLYPKGTKEFAYKYANEVSEKQKFLIRVIEFAYNYTVKFNGDSSKSAYEFIGKYYNTVSFNKKSKAVYRGTTFVGYLSDF